MTTEKRYNNVLDIIDERLIPNEAAKKARGEVFTPLKLVREMLFGLRKSALDAGKTEIWGIDATGKCIPDHEANRVGGIPLEVWRDPNKKWLDPANGIGNFPVVTFYMLDYQLSLHSSDPTHLGDSAANKKKRREHIVENMLYMIEINKGNVNTSRKIFEQMVPGATANICCADTLSMTGANLIEVFGVNRFDVVMGNPPYNSGGTAGNGITIWPDFISRIEKPDRKQMFPFPGALNILKENGYLGFVIPSSWRNGLESIWTVLKENLFLTIKMSDDFPNVNLPIDAWLLKKTTSETTSTYIIDRNKIVSTENIRELPFIPNFGITILKKIINAVGENTLNVLSHSKFDPTGTFGKLHIQKKKDATHIYPIIKTIIEPGPDIYYSDVKDLLQDINKVVIADFTYLYPHIDKKFAGIGRHAYYIPIEDIRQGEEIISFLNSKLMQYMNLAIKIAGGGVQYKLLRYFPHINKVFKSDEEVYAEFDIDKEEKANIHEYINSKLKGRIEEPVKYIKDHGILAKTRSKKAKGGFRHNRTRKIRR